MNRKAVILMAGCLLTGIGAPVMAGDDRDDAAIGSVLGGVVGAVVGNTMGGQSGAVIGAVVGATAGAYIAVEDEDRHYRSYHHDRRDPRHYGDRRYHGDRGHRGKPNYVRYHDRHDRHHDRRHHRGHDRDWRENRHWR